MKIAVDDTDLTEAQWTLAEPLLPPPQHLGRPRTDLRRILNALLYMAKAGCPWRLLPKDFPAWQTVYHVFRKWARERVWEGLNARLRAWARARAGKRSRPTAAILDRQSVKSDPPGGAVGDDAAKPIKGRKRHLLVDSLGLLLGVHVTPASTPERAGAQALLAVTVVKRSDQARGFTVLARRWVVERTFGWLRCHRRLVRDYSN